MNNFNWKKILLKISGESLMGDDSFGINPSVVKSFANQINEVVKLGVQLCIVVGGGNIYRGISNTQNGMDRATGDYMGMLATVMNSLSNSKCYGTNWNSNKSSISITNFCSL